MSDTIDLDAWLADILAGPGGLQAFEAHEGADASTAWVTREVWVARWVLRCLANPACEGSREVLVALWRGSGV